jgi:hypothetical protein
VYDYNLGRFMSVDPYIQSPTNSQSMNPYSYIMNNPLSGTDPSGYAACQASRLGESGSAGDCLTTTGSFADGPNKPKLDKQESITVVVSNGTESEQKAAADAVKDELTKAGLNDQLTLAYGSLDFNGSEVAQRLSGGGYGGGNRLMHIPGMRDTEANAAVNAFIAGGLGLSGAWLASIYGPEAFALFMFAGSGGEVENLVMARLPVVKKANGIAVSVNAQGALKAKLSGLQKAQKTAEKTVQLPDGRVRYYSKEIAARTDGPTRGASFVTEYNSKTGSVRQWMESYNQSGRVNRVHPKSINGQTVDAQHYPPTARELGL